MEPLLPTDAHCDDLMAREPLVASKRTAKTCVSRAAAAGSETFAEVQDC